MVLISGPARSGKSTFAGHVGQLFGGVRVSFGDAVRRRALALGLASDRSSLQQIGERWVADDPAGLCDEVIASVAEQPRLVVDGVRHMEIYQLLQMRAEGRRVVLVFIETASSIRRIRLGKGGVDDAAAANAIMAHSTESELPSIRRVADLIVDGSEDPAEALSDLRAALGSPPRSE
jgi:dephospho-CoA kinase